MGQAKQRGTRAERLAQSAEAKRKVAEELGKGAVNTLSELQI